MQPNTYSDSDFMKDSIRSKKDPVNEEQVITDGAYDCGQCPYRAQCPGRITNLRWGMNGQDILSGTRNCNYKEDILYVKED